ncbi:protease SohB [Pseudomonas syringae pv. actinidiae]|nr:protease SohB [Pseudomonas syringae pv. actinidiae]
MNFLADYGSFLLKTLTITIALLAILGALFASKKSKSATGQLNISPLNQFYSGLKQSLEYSLMGKAQVKAAKKAAKAEKKSGSGPASKSGKRVFVLDFDGDIKASAVETMRHEVTALLSVAKPTDEVVIRLETGGGMVHAYGLASSHLVRIREAGIPLTICVDKIAASGGYMMACIADKIVSAPFAILGSIGVVSQMPNINRFLKKHDIDVELLTAGEYKRTLTVIGENTEAGRAKYQEDLDVIHGLFKAHVSKYRTSLDIAKVATGESWYGTAAKDMNLVDEIITSDEYLAKMADGAELLHLRYELPKQRGLKHRLGLAAATVVDNALMSVWSRLTNNRMY